MRAILAAVVLFLPGCVMGIPDADSFPRPKPPEPCQVWVVIQPDNVARCVSRERLRRELCGKLVEC